MWSEETGSDGVLSRKSMLVICRQIVGHFKRSIVTYNKLNADSAEYLRSVTKTLDEDHTMKHKLLESLNHSFADIEDLALATLLDPAYKLC